jgi:hypothetical protein
VLLLPLLLPCHCEPPPAVQSFSATHVGLDQERTGGRVYLHLVHHKVLKAVEEVAAAAAAPITKFAIGVEGGFQTEESKWRTDKTYSVVVFPGGAEFPCVARQAPLPSPLPPLHVCLSSGVARGWALAQHYASALCPQCPSAHRILAFEVFVCLCVCLWLWGGGGGRVCACPLLTATVLCCAVLCCVVLCCVVLCCVGWGAHR